MTDSIIFFPCDTEITITINNADETAFDLSAADGDVVVVLYQRKNNIVQRFAYSDDSVDISDPSTGQLTIRLDRKNTEFCDQDILFAEIDLVMIDSDYEDGEKHVKIGDIEIAEMRRSMIEL